jgi:hypothetical protein
VETRKQLEQLEKLEQSLKRKQIEALEAKDKGLNTVYGNIVLEIAILKQKIKKFQMGGK